MRTMNNKTTDYVRKRSRTVLAPAVFVLTMVILELALLLSKTPDYLIPTPSSVFREFIAELMAGRIIRHAAITFSEALLGFFLSFMIGAGLATIVDRARVLSDVIQPFTTAFQATPKVALAPIIILWFGFGMASKIALVVLISFFLVFVATLSGLRSLGTPLLELMRSYGATEWQIFWKVKLPNALPFIFTGAETALLYSLTGAVMGEFLGSKEGLGYLIQLWSTQMRTASSFAAILMLVIIALVTHVTLVSVRNRVLFWITKS